MSIVLLVGLLLIAFLLWLALNRIARIETEQSRIDYRAQHQYRNSAEQLSRIEGLLQPAKPVLKPRVVPRYPTDYESSQIQVLDEFKEKA